MSCNTSFLKRKNILVENLLVCTHKFVVAVCVFLNMCVQFDIIFLKMY